MHNNLPNIKKLLIIMAVANLVVLVAYSAFFLHIRAKNKAISTFSNEVDLVVQKEIRLRSIQSLIKDTEADRAQLENYFVGGEDAVVGFIETIEELAVLTETALEITSVSVDNIGDDGSSIGELLRLNVRAEGQWKNVFHLFSLIELLPLKVTITRASFEGFFVEGAEGAEGAEPSAQSWEGTFGLTVVKLSS